MLIQFNKCLFGQLLIWAFTKGENNNKDNNNNVVEILLYITTSDPSKTSKWDQDCFFINFSFLFFKFWKS